MLPKVRRVFPESLIVKFGTAREIDPAESNDDRVVLSGRTTVTAIGTSISSSSRLRAVTVTGSRTSGPLSLWVSDEVDWLCAAVCAGDRGPAQARHKALTRMREEGMAGPVSSANDSQYCDALARRRQPGLLREGRRLLRSAQRRRCEGANPNCLRKACAKFPGWSYPQA